MTFSFVDLPFQGRELVVNSGGMKWDQVP